MLCGLKGNCVDCIEMVFEEKKKQFKSIKIGDEVLDRGHCIECLAARG